MTMALSVHRALPKYAAALLSPPCLEKLRVPAEFAARLGGEEGGRTVVVLLVSPIGSKVWRAELRRAGGDSGEWQLGNGWPEFVAAHGVGAGWSVVFRLERRGVATVRAFDAAGCLARFCTPLPVPGVTVKNRPRFIKLLHPEDLEKMKLPDKFFQVHLTESSQQAIIFSHLGKFWRIELERDHPGALRGDGWARFLRAHDVSEGNTLVFRYEGNMVFTVEVFFKDGRLKEYEPAADADITDGVAGPSVPQAGVKQPGVSPVKMKRKNRNENAYVERSDKKLKVSSVPANKVASKKKLGSIMPRHSFTKRITGYDLKSHLAVKGTFCSAVDLLGACEITLKSSVGKTKSWPVSFNTANTYGYIKGPGWKRFCRENKIKEGSCCTFNVVETRVWHVTITSG